MSQQQEQSTNDSFEHINTTPIPSPVPPVVVEFPPFGLDFKNLGAPTAEGNNDLVAEAQNGGNPPANPLKQSPGTSRRFIFSAQQLHVLEARFNGKDCLSAVERNNLAKELGLRPDQVKIWFQNRRYKQRKAERAYTGIITTNTDVWQQKSSKWFKDKLAERVAAGIITTNKDIWQQKAPKWFKETSFIGICAIAVLIALLAAFLAFSNTANTNLEQMRRESAKNAAKLHEFQQKYTKEKAENNKKLRDEMDAKLAQVQAELILVMHKNAAKSADSEKGCAGEKSDQMDLYEVKLAHFLEHQNAKLSLVNNSKNGWNTGASHGLTVSGHTVTFYDWSIFANWLHIRTTHGFSTVPKNNVQLGYSVNYAEGNKIFMLLASEDLVVSPYGRLFGSYFYGFSQLGDVCKKNDDKCWHNDPALEFGMGDTIGCGVLLIHPSVTAKWANCKRCEQPHEWVFFTKNGNILGTPQPLPANAPFHLYPTIVMRGHWEQVTANFGQSPFLYAIPPALGLCVGQHCQQPVF